MEQRLDALEEGLATVTGKLSTIQEHIEEHGVLVAKQDADAESMLLTRLDLMDVGCLLEPLLNKELPTDNILEQSVNGPTGVYCITENENPTEDFDTLILD